MGAAFLFARNDATGVRGRKLRLCCCGYGDRGGAGLRPDEAIRGVVTVVAGRTATSKDFADRARRKTRPSEFEAKEKKLRRAKRRSFL